MKNFVVYKSSAGSGKTFTLVREYLRLALYDASRLQYGFRKILAVTFTNKAAAEMKSRVLEALTQITRNEKLPVIGQVLLEELKITTEELQRRSAILLTSILHHYADFSISTIDSFTHKIVKTFAHDLRLPVNFNVETDTRSFYDKIVSQLLAKVGEDEYVSKLLKEYVLERAEESESWDPEKQIREFSQLLEKENSAHYLKLLRNFSADDFEGFRRQFREFTAGYRAATKELASTALDLITASALKDEDFRYKSSGPQNIFNKSVKGEVTLADANGSRILEAIATGRWAGGNNPALIKIEPRLTQLAGELVAYINANYRYYALCKLLAKQMYPLMLLKKIEELTNDQKQEDRLVFISEFNERIHQVIQDEPAPFIYERLGERYNHFLIDEFQDTSSMQWLNLIPLLDNSLSAGWFNLVVGDGKQSIYRWRNANVKQFAALPEVANPLHQPLLAERAETLERNYSGQLLDVNYRSLRTLVEFNNNFFRFLKERTLNDEVRKIYSHHEQKWNRDETGLVTLNAGVAEREELDDALAAIVIGHTRKAMIDGYSAGDICVLVRSNIQGSAIASRLMQENIPVVSSDSLLLSNSLEVNVLVCFLTYLSNPQDKISAAAVITYLFQTGRIDALSYDNALQQLKERDLSGVLQNFDIRMNERGLALDNILDTCVHFIRELRIENGTQYLRFFLDEVNEFLVTQNASLPSFLDWWSSRKKNASLVIPGSSDAVKIMTIHASKGLEFPVVITPCSWPAYRAQEAWVNVRDERAGLPVGVVSLSGTAGESGFEEELQQEQQDQETDNYNLLYVAFTRAVDRLHIITLRSGGQKLPTVANWIEDFFEAAAEKKEGDLKIIGAIRNKEQHTGRKTEAMLLEPLIFDSPENAIRVKAAWLPHGERPSNENGKPEIARAEGILLHWLLSRITKAEETSAALDEGIRRGMLHEGQRAEYQVLLQKVISHPQLITCFDGTGLGRREAEIITSLGNVLRPNLVVERPGDVTLVDYKTGVRRKEHVQQLQEYAFALREMGAQRVNMLLVYVDPLEVVEVI